MPDQKAKPVHLERLESLVPVDFREREVHKLSYLIKGQMDHKEPVEKLELQDQLEKGEIQVKLETQGREEHLLV